MVYGVIQHRASLSSSTRKRLEAHFGEALLKVAKNFFCFEMPLSLFWRDTQRKRRKCFAGERLLFCADAPFSYRSKKGSQFLASFVASWEGGLLFDAQKGEKRRMFLASDVIKHRFGAHTENEESSSLPVAKHFLCMCHAKIRLFCFLSILPSLSYVFCERVWFRFSV